MIQQKMTFLYAINCLVLAHAPIYLSYRFTKLNEYRAFSKCLYVGGVYLLTAAFRLMVLGSLLPFAFPAEGESLSLVQAIVRVVVNLVEVAALAYVVGQFQRDLKILVPAIGWVGAKTVVERLLGIVVGARGVEFEWKYFQSAVDANLDLFNYLTLAGLLFLLARKDLPQSWFPLLVGVLLLTRLDEVFAKVFGIFVPSLADNSWLFIAVRLVLTGITAFITQSLVASSNNQSAKRS